MEKQFKNRSMDNFGERLSKYMDKKGIKVDWLAKEAGVSVRTVQSWMCYNGKNKNGRFPKLEKLLTLRIVLHTSIDVFLR